MYDSIQKNNEDFRIFFMYSLIKKLIVQEYSLSNTI